MAFHDAEPLPATGQWLQQFCQQADAIIVWRRCSPGTHIVKPALTHQLRTYFGYYGDRLARCGYEYEPGAGRALPERGMKASKITNLWLCHQQQACKVLFCHERLRILGAGAELCIAEAALGSFAVRGTHGLDTTLY